MTAATTETSSQQSTRKTQSQLWQIRGKFYDFDSFVHEHPGGVEMIMLGKGRDCTELFESVHALSSKRPWELLRRHEYQVQIEEINKEAGNVEGGEIVASEELFTWDKAEGGTGFFETVTKRVKEHIKKDPTMQGNYKATWRYFTKLAMMLVCYVFFLYNALYTTHHRAYRYVFALLAGIVSEQIHFCAMHDGSHGSISKNPAINDLGGSVTNWFFWDVWIWLRHHCFAHHCYTGMYRRDPDLTNSKIFMRKHHEASWKPSFKMQHVYVWFWMMIFPNQHWGQTLVYSKAVSKKRVFGVPLDVEYKPANPIRYMVHVISFLVHFVLPLMYMTAGQLLLSNFIIWTVIGISYFVVVLPNHDTDDVAKSIISPIVTEVDPKTGKKVQVIKKVDWGEMQVRNSSNHSIDGTPLSWIVTHLYGGMNFQIEHHLFPSMCHEHYEKVAPIVQQTCKEFNIPYNVKKTWFDSLVGFYLLLKDLGQKNPGATKKAH